MHTLPNSSHCFTPVRYDCARTVCSHEKSMNGLSMMVGLRHLALHRAPGACYLGLPYNRSSTSWRLGVHKSCTDTSSHATWPPATLGPPWILILFETRIGCPLKPDEASARLSIVLTIVSSNSVSSLVGLPSGVFPGNDCPTSLPFIQGVDAELISSAAKSAPQCQTKDQPQKPHCPECSHSGAAEEGRCVDFEAGGKVSSPIQRLNIQGSLIPLDVLVPRRYQAGIQANYLDKPQSRRQRLARPTALLDADIRRLQ